MCKFRTLHYKLQKITQIKTSDVLTFRSGKKPIKAQKSQVNNEDETPF